MGAANEIGKTTNKYEKICRCSQFLKGEIKRETDPDAHLANFNADEPWGAIVNDIEYDDIEDHDNDGDDITKELCFE